MTRESDKSVQNTKPAERKTNLLESQNPGLGSHAVQLLSKWKAFLENPHWWTITTSLRPLHLWLAMAYKYVLVILRKWISLSPSSTIWVTQNYSSTSFTGLPFRFFQRAMLSFLFLLVSVNQNFLVPSAVPQRINLASPNWMHSGFKYLS